MKETLDRKPMKENTTPTRAGAADGVGLLENLQIRPRACRSAGTPAQTADGQIRAPTPRRSAGRRSPTSRVRRRFPVGRATVGAHAFPASPSICYHARTRHRPRPETFILLIMGNTTLPLTSAGRRPLRNEPMMATEAPVRPSPIHGRCHLARRLHRRAGLAGRAFIAGLHPPGAAFLLPPLTKRTHFRPLFSSYSPLPPFTKRTHDGR